MDRDTVVKLMESSNSAEEWGANCRKVKEAFNGYYPTFWYEAILESGAARRIMARFGRSPDITAGGAE